ncbi:MAG TPA: thioredoxin family protein [Bacillota bacterium]|nr:thioredoxin family protein [Bacillota bacterium]HOQ02510.1 thioredoxin family protein [Bacillota bacterium]HPP60133.1 thioredoxin family protein [Bacillota bacterium]HPV12852.1 thioredoxin family protein [Bacillota bacterium]HQD73814.1 thioredoxin family protein [Bacillota bacterium]
MSKRRRKARVRKHTWLIIVIVVVLLLAGSLYFRKIQSDALDETNISVKDLTPDTLAVYQSKGKPLIVEFYTKDSPYCRRIESELTMIVENYGGELIVAKIDAQLYPGEAEKYQIVGVPTLVLFNSHGDVLETLGGYRTFAEIEEVLRDLNLI